MVQFSLKVAWCAAKYTSSADANKPARRHVIYIYIIGSDDARPSYCVLSVFIKAVIRHFGFIYFRNFCENANLHLFYVVMQHLVKIGRSAAKLLRIIDFQNECSPPFWIWYDIIADQPTTCVWWSYHPPKIACWSCLYFVRYRDFYIWPVWLEIAYSRPFSGSLGDITGFPLELGIGARGQKLEWWD